MVKKEGNPRPLALVTGSASPLGAAISRALAQEGYDLILHYGRSQRAARSLGKELGSAGAQAHLFQADLSRPAALGKRVRSRRRSLARLSLLVNNASLFERTPTDAFQAADWARILSVNLMAPYALGAALRPFLEANGGSVVQIADIYGEHPLLRDHAAYCASKGALITLTRYLANEWGPWIRVNAVSPGVISFPAHYGAAKRRALAAKAALKRGGDPADIARAVLFLAREPFVTGQVLRVDGGRFL